MSKPFKKRKLPKYAGGGKELKDLGLFAADSMLAEWAPNAIKQDQYSDTSFGKNLGNAASVHESFDSQSPISKNVSKMWNDNKTGMNETQMGLYKQAQPIAKTGSKIGEMWTAKGMSGVGGDGVTGQMIQQGTQQGLNAQYNPTVGMQGTGPVQNTQPSIRPGMPEDPNITGSNAYGMKQQNPYYPYGGNIPQGGNAQLEKQENTLNPDGTTTQFNLPSHSQQTEEEGTVLDPGTLIFSDRLKPKGEKKTFAILNKPNNTDKEDKTLDNPKSNHLSKKTAELMKGVKNKNSEELFKEQESMKQEKAESQAFKDFMACGGMIKYSKGGIHINPANKGKFTAAANRAGMSVQAYAAHVMSHKENFSSTLVKRANFAKNAAHFKHADGGYQPLDNPYKHLKYIPAYPDGGGYTLNKPLTDSTGFPIDYTGRRLTDPEQLGYNRPFNSYNNGAGTLSGVSNVSGTNGITGNVSLGIQDSRVGMGNNITPYKPAGFQSTTPVVQNSNETFEQAYKRTYGKPLYSHGGFIPHYVGGGMEPMKTERLQPMNSEEPTLLEYNPFTIERPEGKNTYDFSNLDKKENTSQGTNWKDIAYQTGMGLANSAGALAYLGEQGKKYDKQNFYNYTLSHLDPTASLRDVTNEGRIAKYDLADKSSGNSGNYLSNRSALGTSIGLAKDKIRREYGNINAQIDNQGAQYNIGNKYMTDDINARNKGQALTNYYKAINSLGSNAAQAGRDYKSGQRDQESMKMMNDMFSNYKFDSKTNSWIFKK